MNEDHALLSSATVIDLKKQDVVFQEGDPADDSFYFVILGCLGVYRGKRGISTMYQGHFFGEIALILNEPRTATVLVQSETARLARFSRESFLEESRHNIHLTLRMLLTTLGRQLRILNEVRNAQQDGFRGLDTAGPILAELRQVNASIADSLTRMHVTYRPRDRAVFREGDRCDGNAFFILDGEITIYERVNGVDIEAARLSAGDIFGMEAFTKKQEHRQYSAVVTSADSRTVFVDRDLFVKTAQLNPEFFFNVFRYQTCVLYSLERAYYSERPAGYATAEAIEEEPEVAP